MTSIHQGAHLDWIKLKNAIHACKSAIPVPVPRFFKDALTIEAVQRLAMILGRTWGCWDLDERWSMNDKNIWKSREMRSESGLK